MDREPSIGDVIVRKHSRWGYEPGTNGLPSFFNLEGRPTQVVPPGPMHPEWTVIEHTYEDPRNARRQTVAGSQESAFRLAEEAIQRPAVIDGVPWNWVVATSTTEGYWEHADMKVFEPRGIRRFWVLVVPGRKPKTFQGERLAFEEGVRVVKGSGLTPAPLAQL